MVAKASVMEMGIVIGLRGQCAEVKMANNDIVQIRSSYHCIGIYTPKCPFNVQFGKRTNCITRPPQKGEKIYLERSWGNDKQAYNWCFASEVRPPFNQPVVHVKHEKGRSGQSNNGLSWKPSDLDELARDIEGKMTKEEHAAA